MMRLQSYALLVMGAMLVAALATAAWSHHKARGALERVQVMQTQLDTANASLKAVLEDRDRTAATAAERVKRAEQRRRAAERQKKDLEDAIKAEPAWADQPVPDGVWRNLGPAAGDSSGPSDRAGAGVPNPTAPGQSDERGAGPLAERLPSGP